MEEETYSVYQSTVSFTHSQSDNLSVNKRMTERNIISLVAPLAKSFRQSDDPERKKKA